MSHLCFQRLKEMSKISNGFSFGMEVIIVMNVWKRCLLAPLEQSYKSRNMAVTAIG